MIQSITISIVALGNKDGTIRWNGHVGFAPAFNRTNGDVVTRVEYSGTSMDDTMKFLMNQETVKECIQFMNEEAQKSADKVKP